MQLFYYKGKVPNFGDDLNAWLWPRLIPEVIADENDGNILLPIGSILFDNFPAEKRKVVLGSGYGGYTAKPKIDGNWHFYFVRGPRTAAALGISPDYAITDAAILLRTQPELLEPIEKIHKVSFMPHWESAMFGSWAGACAQAGINYIDPRNDPLDVLERLRQSEVLLTEAMHGAIVADTLRIPWIPVLPTGKEHRFKWLDWCDSMQVDYKPQYLGASTVNEFMRLKQMSKFYPKKLIQTLTGRSGGGFDWVLRKVAAKRLKELSSLQPFLSSLDICEARTEQAIQKVNQLKVDFQSGMLS